MVRVISQETYDEVVKENIEELCMSPEEAIQEAVEQFTAQGVDLTNIIKDLILSDKDDIKNIINAISNLDKQSNTEQLLELLNKLKIQLDQDIARRVYAGKNGAYSMLISLINNCKENKTLLQLTLKTITSLMSGNPDLLDKSGINTQKRLLDNSADEDTLILILKWIEECCIKHEMNRQRIFEIGIADTLVKLLSKDDISFALTKRICSLMRTFTLDDDVRCEFGKAHEHASTFAKKALGILISSLSKFKNNNVAAGELLPTLTSVVVRNEFCQEFKDAGGIEDMLDIFSTYVDSERINSQAFKLLKRLAGNDEVKAYIVHQGFAPVITLSISRLRSSDAVVVSGLACISSLTLKSPSNATTFYECGAVPIIIDCIKSHNSNGNVYQQAARAIRNMSVRNKIEAKEFLDQGIEELFRNALSLYGAEIESDLKAALRDLDLTVDLKERWQGKGNALTN